MNASHFSTVAFLTISTACWSPAQSNAQRRGPERGAVSPLVQALDLDGNGTISTSELEKAPKSLLTLDKNADHELSREELRPSGSAGRRGGDRGRSGPGRGRDGRRGGGGPRPTELGASPLDLSEPGIAWYGRLDLAKKEAERSNRPILFMAAASQCGGVPGVF
jgi:hypothetical protein